MLPSASRFYFLSLAVLWLVGALCILVALVDAHSVVVNPADVTSPLNSIGHLVLKAGSILGLPALPLWAWLVSRAVRANTSLEQTREG